MPSFVNKLNENFWFQLRKTSTGGYQLNFFCRICIPMIRTKDGAYAKELFNTALHESL